MDPTQCFSCEKLFFWNAPNLNTKLPNTNRSLAVKQQPAGIEGEKKTLQCFALDSQLVMIASGIFQNDFANERSNLGDFHIRPLLFLCYLINVHFQTKAVK